MAGVLIAAPSTGSGKTLITLSILRALRNRNTNVSCFKAGPDFLDPKFHQFASGKACYNLDAFMLAPQTLCALYALHSKDTDFSVVEGVMGLFDGIGASSEASSAAVAVLLGLPILLVLDAHAAGRTLSAVIRGCSDFMTGAAVAGVILNRITEERYQSLKPVLESDTGVPCLGFFPQQQQNPFASRHLGLIPPEELTELDKSIEALAHQASCSIDLDAVLNLSASTKPDLESALQVLAPFWNFRAGEKKRLGIVLDKAFHFYYRDNFELLEHNGFELVFFSLLDWCGLPQRLDALWIGGGYPEVYAEELAANKEMLAALAEWAACGKPLFAECGGFMLLCSALRTIEGRSFPFVHVFPGTAVCTEKLQHFGYVHVWHNGVHTRAHEFHYSKYEPGVQQPQRHYRIRKAGTGKVWECGLREKNVLAGYPHFHLYAEKDFTRSLLNFLAGEQSARTE